MVLLIYYPSFECLFNDCDILLPSVWLLVLFLDRLWMWREIKWTRMLLEVWLSVEYNIWPDLFIKSTICFYKKNIVCLSHLTFELNYVKYPLVFLDSCFFFLIQFLSIIRFRRTCLAKNQNANKNILFHINLPSIFIIGCDLLPCFLYPTNGLDTVWRTLLYNQCTQGKS